MLRVVVAVAIALTTFAGVARADDVVEARKHYVEGMRAYDLGHFKEAASDYEAAYKAKDDPALLFNMGQAYRLAGDNESALNAYKSFLRRVPNTPRRAEVEGHITALQALVNDAARHRAEAAEAATQIQLATTRAEAAQAEAAAAEAKAAQLRVEQQASAPAWNARRVRTFEIAGIGTGVLGLALLGAGGGFVAGAKSANDDVNHPQSGVFSPSAESRRNTFQALDVAFFTIGGVALATGVTLFVLGHQKGKEARAVRAINLAEVSR